MYARFIALILVGIFSWTTVVSAEMSSTNFQIQWDTVSTGGTDASSSGSYQLRDTVGNAGIGDASSASYNLAAGYRNGVFDQVITFDVFAERSTSERAASALVGTTVTADTDSIAVGDFIAVVQDKGSAQVTGIGRVTSLGSGTITVDELTDAGVAPVVDGTNDFVYLLEGGSIALGQLDPSTLTTAVIGFDVSADVSGGYIVQVIDDGDLRDGSSAIANVADGTVTVGSEEYGGRSSDTSLAGSTFDTADTGFSTSLQDVADTSTPSFDSRNFVVLKASIAPSTTEGSYHHQLSFIASGSY